MTAPADTGLATMLLIVGGLGLLIGIAIYVWYAFALSRLFPRIDGEGWKGWVPVLNEAEILARGGVPAWSVVFYFIPLVQLYGIYLKVVATHRINKRFGHGAGMTVLAILLPPVWATVLAWGAAPYPEGERLAALQPGPRRSAPPAAAPARDASGYTIPSFSPSGMPPAEAPALVFPDYAPPARTAEAEASAPTDAPAPAPSAWGAPPQPTAAQPPVADAPVRSFAPPAQPPAPHPVGTASAPPPPAPQTSASPPSAPEAFAPQPFAPPPPAPPQAAPRPPASPEPVAPAEQPVSAPLPPAPAEAHPTTGIMAAMSGLPAAPATGALEQPPAAAPEAPQPSAPEPPAAPLFVEVPSAHPATSVFEPVARPSTPAVSDSLPPVDEPQPVEPVDEPQRAVRSVPPSFRDGGSQDAAPQMPTIRPAPDLSVGAPLEAPPIASQLATEQPVSPAASLAPSAPQAPAAAPIAPQGGLHPEVDATVLTPRPTDDDLDATVVVARKRGVRRVLVLDDGRRFALSGASVVIGRNPTGEAGEQRLAISDTTRTLSKTHARLVVQEDEWRLTDLHATNGVVVVADDGSEMLLDPGESVIGTGRFILGEVGMHVVAERDS